VGLYLLHPWLRRWYRQFKHGGRLVVLAFVVQLGCGLVDEVSKQSMPRPEWVALAAVSLACLPLLGYFVLGYFLLDHAADFVDAMRRPAMRLAALVTWLTAGAIVAAYWTVPLLAGRSFRTITLPYLPHVLLGPPLSIAALVLLFVWLPKLRGVHLVNRFVQTCGLYAYGVYYLHLLVLELVGRGLTAVVGLDGGSVGFYALQFLSGSLASVYAVRQLARLPYTKYLV
jgi:peptidoglycan/LPS O-acetylase OafA/YrhL